MKVYTVDRWRDYGVDKDLVLCSTIELAEKEIVRLKEEDEQAFNKAENALTKVFPFVKSNYNRFTYKVREVNLLEDKANHVNQKLIQAKQDELHYLEQIYKNLKHIQNLYQGGCLKNKDKAYHVDVSLNNTLDEIINLRKELHELTNNEL